MNAIFVYVCVQFVAWYRIYNVLSQLAFNKLYILQQTLVCTCMYMYLFLKVIAKFTYLWDNLHSLTLTTLKISIVTAHSLHGGG